MALANVTQEISKAADDRSLTGEEADEDVQSILAALKADHNAVLR